jgi:hypothetical protein
MAFPLHYILYLCGKTRKGLPKGTLNSSLKKERGPLKLKRSFFLLFYRG